MDNEISEEEAKHDLKEFRKLQKYVNAVYKDVSEGTYDILIGEELEKFTKAINDAKKQVDKLAPYFDELEKNMKNNK